MLKLPVELKCTKFDYLIRFLSIQNHYNNDMNSFRCAIIPILADILADAQKEKVSRIILAVFRVSFYIHASTLNYFDFIYNERRFLSYI